MNDSRSKPSGTAADERRPSRREWLRTGARCAVLAGLGGLTLDVLRRAAGHAPCDRAVNGCAGCGLLPQCRLPQADQARTAGKTEGARDRSPLTTRAED